MVNLGAIPCCHHLSGTLCAGMAWHEAACVHAVTLCVSSDLGQLEQ